VPPARLQRKGAHWGMGGARTAGGGSRDRTRHYPLTKNPLKMEEVQKLYQKKKRPGIFCPTGRPFSLRLLYCKFVVAV
jgi:hypothetical protein